MEERMVVIPPSMLQHRSCIFYELVVTSDIKKEKKKKDQIPLGYLAPLKATKCKQMF